MMLTGVIGLPLYCHHCLESLSALADGTWYFLTFTIGIILPKKAITVTVCAFHSVEDLLFPSRLLEK